MLAADIKARGVWINNTAIWTPRASRDPDADLKGALLRYPISTTRPLSPDVRNTSDLFRAADGCGGPFGDPAALGNAVLLEPLDAGKP